jgi:GT2 family glycosyltransferase
MAGLSASVVVVSRGRPRHLSRCLTALSQQYYRPFEIVVVADADGARAARAHMLSGHLKIVPFDVPNISAARNAGLQVAAGDVVAFIDDDAVAEPTWLTRLIGAFAETSVDIAGGVVLGRNGISIQWGPRVIQRDAHHRDLSSQRTLMVLPPPGDGAIKTEGTNFAVRRSRLEDVGGFDEAYPYYLDEADLNMRLARMGAQTALVCDALVHHAMAASDRRRGNRCPTDMHDVGASLAVFLSRYGDPAMRASDLAGHRQAAVGQMLRHMIAGSCEPGQVDRVLATFDAGVADGAARTARLFHRTTAPDSFRPLPVETVPIGHKVITGRGLSSARCLAAAEPARSAGFVTSVFCFSRTSLYHRVRMTDRGIWVQTGGLFGRSERNQQLVRYRGLDQRVEEECERIRAAREVP